MIPRIVIRVVFWRGFTNGFTVATLFWAILFWAMKAAGYG